MQILARIVERVPRPFFEAAVRVRNLSPFLAGRTQWLADRLHKSDVMIRTGLAAGLRFTAGRSNVAYLANGTLEPDTEQALAEVLRPKMTFYDVGGHFGLHSLIAARIVGPLGSVLSFEPLRENQSLFEHNVRLNNFGNIRCIPVAVGDRDCESTFLLSSCLSCGALADQPWSPEGCVGEVAVEVRRLDTLIAEGKIPSPQVVKMDIEGGETAALAGAENLLATARPILIIELHETAEAVSHVLTRHRYAACPIGSRAPIERMIGNVHIIAIPSEHADCGKLLERFGDPSFPICYRCRKIAC